MSMKRVNENPLSAEQKDRLNAAHAGLLRVHKALIEYERGQYEIKHGPIPSAVHFLDLLINDPWFAWVGKISKLAVQIDEIVSSKEKINPADAEAMLTEADKLLKADASGSEFERKYAKALEKSPAAVEAHGEWKVITGQSGGN